MTWTGPLFLIGMPRSGTKLLRELLNASGRVGIPYAESEFLPYWLGRWSGWGDLSDRATFQRFYDEVSQLPYFGYERSQGVHLDADTWHRSCAAYTPAAVFEALIRHDAAVPPGSDRVWGDKSPSYIEHMPLLRGLYPDARFLHIVRDVRDYCLSIQKAWSKSPIRAAQRWTDSVQRARADAAAFPHAYLEVRYEDLLRAPELVLQRCCALLDIPYDPSMLALSRPTENLGDARGMPGLKRDNTEKWRTAMDPRTRARVESVAADVLRSLGYPVEHPGPPVRVPTAELRALQVLDGLGLIRAEIAERGLPGAVRFRWQTFRISGNRRMHRQDR